MIEQQYIDKREEIISKFNVDFWEEHIFHPLFQQTYQMLVRDADPYEIIEQLINANSELFKKLKQLIENQ